ncbi:splicing regulator SDE2 [Haematobia irritans]|uniref:splicing regulator SDE2 n=1 Tax=Haematobia irritans TaxID=7368 RepID=UPI003F4F6348
MESLSVSMETSYSDLLQYVIEKKKFSPNSFYLEQNGKVLRGTPVEGVPVYIRLRVLGGKGGFGSMLRAIGAQIEKTTNREACRDLSGRRLRDINEEKRLKAWLDKQGDREREAEERKKRKIEKLLAVPKHEFKDEEYEEARSKLTEKVCSSFEEGFKKAITNEPSTQLKRKHEASTSQQAAVKGKAKKPALWIDEDLSDDSEDDSDDSDVNISSKSDQKKLTESTKQSADDVANSSDSESLSIISK